jgi:hypothetical protein
MSQISIKKQKNNRIVFKDEGMNRPEKGTEEGRGDGGEVKKEEV